MVIQQMKNINVWMDYIYKGRLHALKTYFSLEASESKTY